MSHSVGAFGDQFPVERQLQLNAVCERFEEACRRDESLPRIENYLDGFSEDEHRALLPELIYLDNFYRKRRGENPSAEEYHQRFPECPLDSLEGILSAIANADERTAAFRENEAKAEGDSGVPIPAGGSVLKALQGSLSGESKVQLREPRDEPDTPVNRPASEEMPSPKQMPERYQLQGEIARGGMGAILKGHDADLGRDIAVKMLLETHKGKTELLQRFVEEAQINGQLQHPGIVPVYEMGDAGNKRPYFTMKLVKGRTLAALLKERSDRRPACHDAAMKPTGEAPVATDLPKFLGIFEQICQTMAYAHARGVIHRDLKPANIMVGNFGEVQVMDWGLAKVRAEGGVADEGESTAEERSVIRPVRNDGSRTDDKLRSRSPGTKDQAGSRTQAGSVLGTPAYMAPEQARGDVELLDERCDVFGLGAILCQILTGLPPYQGGDANEIHNKAMQADLSEALDWLDRCQADHELIGLTKSCLENKKEDRPRHAGEVSD